MRLSILVFAVLIGWGVSVRADRVVVQEIPPGDHGLPGTIVFLCDGSESMRNMMPTLKDELGKAIVGLRPVQSFDIIFSQDGKFVDCNRGLRAATPHAKDDAAAWLKSISASGKPDFTPAFEMAFKRKPHLIYLVTGVDGLPDPKGVVETITRLNKDRKIKINPIMYVKDASEKEKGESLEPFLKQIADENGGAFRWVDVDAIQDPAGPSKSVPASQPTPAQPAR